MRLYTRDCISVGYCLVPGVRDFFRRHGLDWRSFVRDGIESEVIEGTCDAMALDLIKRIRERRGNN